MNEIRSNTPHTDREKLSQDIERLKLAVKDTSLSRTWDEDSDSDDDVLRITEADDDDDDDDQNNHRGVTDEQSEHRLTAAERYFSEEALQGVSQDSLGSIGSVELSNSPEVCLALNREYQEWIRRNLMKIQLVLEHNRQCQKEVKMEMQEKSSEKLALITKRKCLTIYSKPYFRNADGSFPPLNEDTMLKKKSNELDPFVRPPKIWSTEERDKMRSAVQADCLQKTLRPFMNKKEFEYDRLKMVVPDSKEEEQIKEKIADIDKKIKENRESTDVNVLYGDLKDVDSIDWMKIANVDFEGMRSAEACKMFWINAAHPSINVSKWTPTEDAKLVELVSRYEGVHWEEIAKSLSTNRSAFMCLQRYQTKLNPCLQTGKWTPDEDDFLKEVINSYKTGDAIPWSTVAYYVEGRSREQCARRWEQLHPKSFRKGRWTAEEDEKLMEAARLFGVNKWWKIKEFVPGRTAAQCRERWKNTLDQNIHFGEWKYEEDKKLWLIVQEFGAGHWQMIAKDYLPGRTDNMCLQRYRRLLHWYQENTARYKGKLQSQRGMLKSHRRWKRLSEKQFLRRKQLEKIIERVKVAAKEKATMSALKYVGDVCGDEEKEAIEQHDKPEEASAVDTVMKAETESDDQTEDPCETEAIRLDRARGIFIPRPSTRTFIHRNSSSLLCKIRMRNAIERRVEKHLLSERNTPSSVTRRLRDLISIKRTTAFSQPLQEKLQSLSHNTAIRQLIDLSAEVKEVVSSCPVSACGQQRGRPRRTEEEADIEHKISMLVCDQVAAERQQRKFSGEDLQKSLKSVDKLSANRNSEDIEGKVVHLMSRAMNLRRCAPWTETSLISPSAQSTLNRPPCTNSKFKDSDVSRTTPLKEQSVVLVLKKASSTLENKPQLPVSCDNSMISAPSDPRLTPSILRQSAHGRAALHGPLAKIYSMPPLPPSCSTLNALKTLLLNRAKLLSVAGRFHIPGILPVSNPEKEKQKIMAVKVAGQNEKADDSGDEVKAPLDTGNAEQADGVPTSDQSLTAEAVAETEDDKHFTEDGSQLRSGIGKQLKAASPMSKAKYLKKQKTRSQIIDKNLKQLQLQVVKSKLRSRRVLAAIHASHDYHLLRSRFMSLFLWPALLSMAPVEEVKSCSLVDVTDEPEADDDDDDDDDGANSLPSTEELEQDYGAGECSSDDDWSKKHYKRRYGAGCKSKVYCKWRRKGERMVENTRATGAHLQEMTLLSPERDAFSFAGNCSSQELKTESQHKKRVHRRRLRVVNEPRKSRRLAEKRDLKQKTENQESVIASGHKKIMLKTTDAESDSDSSAPRKKWRRVNRDGLENEEKPVEGQLYETSVGPTKYEPDVYVADENHVQLSGYVIPADVHSDTVGFMPSAVINSGAILQPIVDENGCMRTSAVDSDGFLQPLLISSNQFVESFLDSNGFLRTVMTQSDPSLVNACHFIQPIVVSGNRHSMYENSFVHAIGTGDMMEESQTPAGHHQVLGNSTLNECHASSSFDQSLNKCLSSVITESCLIRTESSPATGNTVLTTLPVSEKANLNHCSAGVSGQSFECMSLVCNYMNNIPSANVAESENEINHLNAKDSKQAQVSEALHFTEHGDGQSAKQNPEFHVVLKNLDVLAKATELMEKTYRSRVEGEILDRPSGWDQAAGSGLITHVVSAANSTICSAVSDSWPMKIACDSSEEVVSDTTANTVTDTSHVDKCDKELEGSIGFVTSVGDSSHLNPSVVERDSVAESLAEANRERNASTIATVSPTESNSCQMDGNIDDVLELIPSSVENPKWSSTTPIPGIILSTDARECTKSKNEQDLVDFAVPSTAHCELGRSMSESRYTETRSNTRTASVSFANQTLKSSVNMSIPETAHEFLMGDTQQIRRTAASVDAVSSSCTVCCQPLLVSAAQMPFDFNSSTQQALCSNILSGLGLTAPTLENITTAAVQQFVALLASQILRSFQMQLQQSAAQNLRLPLANATMQSSDLQSPDVQPLGVGLQLGNCLPPCTSAQLGSTMQVGSGLQQGSGLRIGSGLQPNSGLEIGSGLQPNSGLQIGSGLQLSSGLQASVQPTGNSFCGVGADVSTTCVPLLQSNLISQQLPNSQQQIHNLMMMAGIPSTAAPTGVWNPPSPGGFDALFLQQLLSQMPQFSAQLSIQPQVVQHVQSVQFPANVISQQDVLQQPSVQSQLSSSTQPYLQIQGVQPQQSAQLSIQPLASVQPRFIVQPQPIIQQQLSAQSQNGPQPTITADQQIANSATSVPLMITGRSTPLIGLESTNSLPSSQCIALAQTCCTVSALDKPLTVSSVATNPKQ